MRFHQRRHHNQRHAESAQREVVASGVSGAELRRYIVWRNNAERRHMVIKSSAFVVRQDEDRIVPRRAVHQGINELLDICGALLDVAVWVLIQTSSTKARINPYHRRQVCISRWAGQNVQILLNWERLVLDREVIPVSESWQEYAICEVISPFHTSGFQAGENCWTGPLWSALWCGENPSLRSCAEGVLAVGHGVSQHRRMERVA